MKEIISLDGACKKLAMQQGIRFVGVINSKGRLVAGGFKDGITPHETDEKRQMLFMEVMLDLTMRREFDNTLGTVRAISSRRDKVTMTSIPLGDSLLLISSEPYVSEDVIIRRANEIFNISGGYQN